MLSIMVMCTLVIQGCYIAFAHCAVMHCRVAHVEQRRLLHCMNILDVFGPVQMSRDFTVDDLRVGGGGLE